MNENRHAYLFMVHRDTYVLEKALQLIDDERNDIYIHADARTTDFHPDTYAALVRKSALYLVPRQRVNWAAWSQAKVELDLLAYAGNKTYAYYHLLSGNDLPLKSQDDLHTFFDRHKGKEFIGITNATAAWNRYYYFFTETPFYRTSPVLKLIVRKIIPGIQRLLGFDRWRNTGFIPKWNYTWFSITHDCVNYLLDNRTFIEKHFRYSHAPDECFLGTMVYNDDSFRKKIYQINDAGLSSLRNISFREGKPTILTGSDLSRLMRSDACFARKFDEHTDREVIDRLTNNIYTKRTLFNNIEDEK